MKLFMPSGFGCYGSMFLYRKKKKNILKDTFFSLAIASLYLTILTSFLRWKFAVTFFIGNKIP